MDKFQFLEAFMAYVLGIQDCPDCSVTVTEPDGVFDYQIQLCDDHVPLVYANIADRYPPDTRFTAPTEAPRLPKPSEALVRAAEEQMRAILAKENRLRLPG